MPNRRLRTLALSLLIFGLCFAVLHETQSGDADHSNDCAICVTAGFGDEQDFSLPSPVDFAGVSFEAESQPTAELPPAAAFIRKAWPPQTGPPHRT